MRVWIELRGPARLWAASIAFTILGAIFVFVLPRIFPAIAQAAEISLVLALLGWTFLVLGSLVLLPMLFTLYLRRTRPELEWVWHWWINFIGGLLGALVFAVPASFAFPVFLVAYLMRPNVLIPNDASATNNLGITALFSLIGIITLIATLWLARMKLQNEDPRAGV